MTNSTFAWFQASSAASITSVVSDDDDYGVTYSAFDVDVGGFTVQLTWRNQGDTADATDLSTLKLTDYGKLNNQTFTELKDANYGSASGTAGWHTAYRKANNDLVWDSAVENHAGTGSLHYVVVKLIATFTPDGPQASAYNAMSDSDKNNLTADIEITTTGYGRVWTTGLDDETVASGVSGYNNVVPTGYSTTQSVTFSLAAAKSITLVANTEYQQDLGYYGVFISGTAHGTTANGDVSTTLTAAEDAD